MHTLREFFEDNKSSSSEFRKLLLELIEEANTGFNDVYHDSVSGETVSEKWENVDIQSFLGAIGRIIVEETSISSGIIDPEQNGLSWDQLSEIFRRATTYE